VEDFFIHRFRGCLFIRINKSPKICGELRNLRTSDLCHRWFCRLNKERRKTCAHFPISFFPDSTNPVNRE